MDEIVFIPSTILGGVLIAIYVVRSHLAGTRLDLASMINLILNAAGIVIGVLLVASTYFDGLEERIMRLKLYIVIAGLAIFVVSGQAVKRNLFGETNP